MEQSHITPHAAIRMAQRGVPPKDLELLELIGTEVEGGFLVRAKDFQTFELKRLRDRARKLVGKRLVTNGACVVTVYHTTARKEQRLLRHAEERAFGG